jgi:DNA (cytosine-5)-methyltransferase 1
MKKSIKIGSDCSGVGSFPQAIQRLGLDYTEVFACDFDYYARQTYLLNFGTKEDIELGNTKEHRYYADLVKSFVLEKRVSNKEEELLNEANEFAKKFSFYYPFNMYQREIPNESCDIYMGSFPCQSFSLAGKRQGQEDKRGILFYNGHEFIQKNRPRFFIIENVKGLLSDDDGKTFQRWIDMLAGKSVNGNPVIFPLDESTPYHVYYQVLNAKHYGVPQNRERIFIIGVRDDVDNNFHFPKPIHLTKRLKDVLESEVDEKYFLSDKMLNYLVTNSETQKNNGNGFKFSPTDGNTIGKAVTTKAGSRMDDEFVKTEIGTWRTHEDGRGFRATEDNNCPTIPARAREDGSGQPVIKIGAIRGRNPENPKSRKSGLETEQMLEINEQGTSNCLSTVQKDNVVLPPEVYQKSKFRGGKQPYQPNRVYD